MIDLAKYERRVADAIDDLKRAENAWREAETHMNAAANHLAHCEQELEEYLTAHGNNPETLLPEGGGWIPHTPGDYSPVAGSALIDVMLENGETTRSTHAHEWQWAWKGRHEIIGWRPALAEVRS